MGFQLCLHLAQADILPELQLDQVLLPVHDADRPVLKHLGDVPRTEPPFPTLVVEILCRLLLILEISPSNTCSTNEDLTPANKGGLNHQRVKVSMIAIVRMPNCF